MLGGLLCERRHSEATPAMKPKKLSVAIPPRQCSAVPLPTHPGSVPLPLMLCSSMPSASPPPSQIVLKGEKAVDGGGGIAEEDGETAIVHTGECIRIGNGKYQFWDRPSALVGRGSYGVKNK
jgi:hypothetical protein